MSRGSLQICAYKRVSVSGQAVVEYILLCLVLVIVATAVLSPLRAKFASIQTELAGNTLSVMRQSEMGIPINWFDLQADNSDAKFGKLMTGLSTVGNIDTGGAGAGSNPGGSGPGAGNSPGASPDAPDGPGGGSSPPGGGTSPTGPRSPSSGGGGTDNTSDSSGDIASTSSQEGYKAGQNNTAQGGAKGGGSPGDEGVEGSSSEESAAKDAGTTSGEEGEEEKNKEGGEARGRTQIYDGREEDSRKSGCDSVDFGTLLKIFAILGIVVIGAILLLSGRGGGKNNT